MDKQKLSLYVFGTGEMAKIILTTFNSSMCDIIAFVDERPHTWNTQYMSHPIIGVQDIQIEQCDFVLILCRYAKSVAKRLARDYAIPYEKIVPMDITGLPSMQSIGENPQKEPLITLEMYLSSFPGLFDIMDVDAFMSHPMLEAWLVRATNAYCSPPRNKMKTCENFLNVLNFESSTIQPCCEPEACRIPPGVSHTGGELDLTAYREYINEVFEELQFDTDLCGGCRKLIDTDKSLQELYEEKLYFTWIAINHHRFFCNCKCVYCGYWQTKATSFPYPVLGIIKKLVGDGLVDKNCVFAWGGGESTILKEFEETARWLLNQGYFQWVLTNALQLSPAVLSMLEAGQGKVNISLDSGSSATYKQVKKVNGWEKVIKTCKAYWACTAKSELVILKYIIFDQNNCLEEISNFFNLCMEIGITHVEYSLDIREFHPRSTSQETLKAAAFFVQHAKTIGLHCQPALVNEPYLSQINELALAMESPD